MNYTITDEISIKESVEHIEANTKHLGKIIKYIIYKIKCIEFDIEKLRSEMVDIEEKLKSRNHGDIEL